MMTSSGSSSPSKKLDVQDELSNIKIQKVNKQTNKQNPKSKQINKLQLLKKMVKTNSSLV
jgi:hypothetical protein